MKMNTDRERRALSRARSTRRRAAKFAAATGLAFTLVACAVDQPASDSPEAEQVESDASQVLRYGLSAEPADIKTGVDQGSAAKEVAALVRRGLLQYDSDGEPVPALAAEFDVSDDGKTYTFTLKPNLVFSDGQELTSTDVKRTFEYFAEPENGATYQAQFDGVTSIDTPDDSTVVIELEEPQTAFPQILADPLSAIVPEDPLGEHGGPVGAGPFMITEYRQGVSFLLEANPNFYDAENVVLDKIEMTFMADAQTRVKALLSDQVDFIDYVPASEYQSLEESEGVILNYVPGLYGALLINLENDALSNPKVRQAIAYGIDRDSLNEVGTLGYGIPGGGLPIPEDNEYFDEDQAQYYSHDPERAEALLAEAGYEDGLSLDLVTTSQYFGYSERAQVVKSDLDQIGIDVQIVTGDYAELISKGDSGNYDLLISGPPAAMSDPTALTGAFLGGTSFVRSNGIDEDLYADLLKKGAQTPNGPDRAAIYHELGEIFLEDLPFITTGQGSTAFAHSDQVLGFETIGGALVYSSIYSFENVSLAG